MNRSYEKFLIALSIIVGLLPAVTFAAQTAGYNTGFVKQDIWYSKASLTEGDSVSIYTAVFDAQAEALSGTVAFYDNSIILGKKTFIAPGHTVVTVSIDWKVTAGDHSITAAILDPTVVISGKSQSIYLAESKTPADVFTVAKTILPSATQSSDTTSTNATLSSVSQAITDHVPASITTPITNTATGIDAWRADTGTTLTNDKIAAQKEIDDASKALVATVSIGKDKTTVSPAPSVLKTPLAYVKLFFFATAAFIFQNKILFYSLCALILFFIIRMLWRRFSGR